MEPRYIEYAGTRRSFGRKGFADALAAMRPFVERATDARGLTSIHIGFTHPAVSRARLVAHIPGEWEPHAGMAGPGFRWTALAPGRFQSIDRPEEERSASHDGLAALVADLEREGTPVVIYANWEFLLRDAGTGALLRYRREHFAGAQPWSALSLYPVTHQKYDSQFIGYFPWDKLDENLLAVCRGYDELLPFRLDARRLEYRSIKDRTRVRGYRLELLHFAS